MLFKDKLKNFRTDNNFTQEDLAEKVYVSRTLISKWENGVLYPSSQCMSRLADIMGLKVDELFTTEETKKLLLDSQIINRNNTVNKILHLIALSLCVSGLTILIVSFLIPTNLTTPNDIYQSVNQITIILILMRIISSIMIFGSLLIILFLGLKKIRNKES